IPPISVDRYAGWAEGAAWHAPCDQPVNRGVVTGHGLAAEKKMEIDCRAAGGPEALDSIWMSQSPIPAASGIAWALGWMAEEFAGDGIAIKRVAESGLRLVAPDPERQARHHFREAGNIQALAARSLGAPTRVIGLTWIDEGQAIVVRPDTRVLEPADLRNLRF